MRYLDLSLKRKILTNNHSPLNKPMLVFMQFG